jgi:O-antigen biosynthesis protein WbqP
MLSKKQKMYLILKRVIDIFGSLLGLLVLSPLLFVCWAVTFFATNGHPFFAQPRLGKNKTEFKMIKFRSMKLNAIQAGQENLSIKDQEALTTKWGRFMRKTSIDEVPQLVNILIGNMSFIGPRPGMVVNSSELISYRDSYIPSAYLIKPGLSGYAQIHMKRAADVAEKAREDSYYVRHMSFWLDTRIFVFSFFLAFGIVKGR